MAYTTKEIEKTFDKVITRIEKGEPLRIILKDKTLPSSRTFFKWLEEDSIKVKLYAQACSERTEKLFEDILEIATQSPEKTATEFGSKVDNGEVQHRRLLIDSIKWSISKLNPKKYSDKLQVDTTEFKEQPLFPDVKQEE
jgi:hypothetical protein